MNTDKTSASFLSVFIGLHPWPKCLFGFGWYASSSSFHEIRSPESSLGAADTSVRATSGATVRGHTNSQSRERAELAFALDKLKHVPLRPPHHPGGHAPLPLHHRRLKRVH